MFFEDFPNTVLYVREIPKTGGWKDVLAADTQESGRARSSTSRGLAAWWSIARARTIEMVLEDGAQHRRKPPIRRPTRSHSFKQFIVSLDPETRLSAPRPGAWRS